MIESKDKFKVTNPLIFIGIYIMAIFFWVVLTSSVIHFNNLFQRFSIFVGLTVICIQKQNTVSEINRYLQQH